MESNHSEGIRLTHWRKPFANPYPQEASVDIYIISRFVFAVTYRHKNFLFIFCLVCHFLTSFIKAADFSLEIPA
jgi:hypothetical protein